MTNYPPFIQNLEKVDPEFYKAVSKVYETIMKPGAIDMKTKVLITLAVDSFAGSTGVKAISDLARKMGATEDEIKESLQIAYLIAGNKVLNTSNAAFG